MARQRNSRGLVGTVDAGATRQADVATRELSNYVTTRQAADILGVTQQHVALLIGRGKLQGTKLDYAWLVFRPSIEQYQKTKSAKGRPRSNPPKS